MLIFRVRVDKAGYFGDFQYYIEFPFTPSPNSSVRFLQECIGEAGRPLPLPLITLNSSVRFLQECLFVFVFLGLYKFGR